MIRRLAFMLMSVAIAIGASPSVAAVPSTARTSACLPYVPEAAMRSGRDANVVARVMLAESGGDASAVSPKGAIGCMQIMPATWAEMSARYGLGEDPFDPRMNMIGGALYLADLTKRFGSAGAYAAYNAGPDRYVRYLANKAPLPAETVAYVARLGGDPAHSSTVRMSVRWQEASLFLAHPDTPNTTSEDSTSKPVLKRTADGDIPGARALVRNIRTLTTLFPLSRDAAPAQ